MRRILVAEDNVMIGLVVTADLERAGYAVDGPFMRNAQALDAANAARPDLALVDIDLQGGDSGIDLARALRAEFGVPSVFVTGQAGPAKAARDDALGVLIKPFRGSVLIETVAAALELAAGGAKPDDAHGRIWF